MLCSGIRDVMSHSFGEGYATRSDEEGFGGIYGGNQFFPNKDDKDKDINENHPGDWLIKLVFSYHLDDFIKLINLYNFCNTITVLIVWVFCIFAKLLTRAKAAKWRRKKKLGTRPMHRTKWKKKKLCQPVGRRLYINLLAMHVVVFAE